MKRNLLFVGEERSELAVKMNVTWKDGRLAAKQLFDALNHVGIDPKDCKFTNIFERGGLTAIKNHKKEKGTIVCMGNKVKRELDKRKISYILIVHPAARGTIRKKENYFQHIKESLITNHV